MVFEIGTCRAVEQHEQREMKEEKAKKRSRAQQIDRTIKNQLEAASGVALPRPLGLGGAFVVMFNASAPLVSWCGRVGRVGCDISVTTSAPEIWMRWILLFCRPVRDVKTRVKVRSSPRRSNTPCSCADSISGAEQTRDTNLEAVWISHFERSAGLQLRQALNNLSERPEHEQLQEAASAPTRR